MTRAKNVLQNRIINTVLFICFTLIINSQNLVVNGDFSAYNICPQKHIEKPEKIEKYLKNWFCINNSTPDFFHRCAVNTEVSVPKNFAGYVEPVVGSGYVGIILRVNPDIYPHSPFYTENIATELLQPLEKDSVYCFSFNYMLAQNSGLTTNGLGIMLSDTLPAFLETTNSFNFKPQIQLNPAYFVPQEPEWQSFVARYKARGREKFLVIGNFNSYDESSFKLINPSQKTSIEQFAYVYIDNVKLEKISKNKICQTSANVIINEKATNVGVNIKPENIVKNNFKTIVLNVYFDFDKNVIDRKSTAILDSVYTVLKNNSSISVDIEGHTDNIGSKTYNQKLSEARAKAVFEYLYNKGISINRLNYKGFGSTRPVADNRTEEGRMKNRRVELIFKQTKQ